MSDLFVVHSTLRVRSIYTCCECGRTAAGDLYTVEVEGPPDGLDLPLLPRHMPVGWAAYGRHKYRCPSHVI